MDEAVDVCIDWPTFFHGPDQGATPKLEEPRHVSLDFELIEGVVGSDLRFYSNVQVCRPLTCLRSGTDRKFVTWGLDESRLGMRPLMRMAAGASIVIARG